MSEKLYLLSKHFLACFDRQIIKAYAYKNPSRKQAFGLMIDCLAMRPVYVGKKKVDSYTVILL